MTPLARLDKSLHTHGLLGTLRLAVGLVTNPVRQAIQRRWVARCIRRAARRFDRQFHVDTSGWIDGKNLDGGENARHATAYDGVLPGPFREVMDQIGIDFAQYWFIDFGSGKGRAVFLAAEHPFARIVGLEFSPRLHEAARSNCTTYRNAAQACKAIELHCMDATQFDLPEVPTVLFFFNPFREEIMQPVAVKVQKSLQMSAHSLRGLFLARRSQRMGQPGRLRGRAGSPAALGMAGASWPRDCRCLDREGECPPRVVGEREIMSANDYKQSPTAASTQLSGAPHNTNQGAAAAWEIRHSIDRPSSPLDWNRSVEGSADASLYHRAEIAPLFLEPAADKLVFVECLLDGKMAGGAILAVTRYRWHRFFERRTIRASLGPLSVSPFVVDGLGAKVTDAAFDRLVDACVAFAEELRADFLVLSDTPVSRRTMVERPLQNRYYTSTHWASLVMYDYALDLRRDVDELWKNVSSAQRGHIRKARSLPLVPGTELGGGRDAYADLLETMYCREKIRLLTRPQLLSVFDSVYDGVHGQCFFSLCEGEPAAVAGISRSGNVASYLHGARAEGAMNGASSLCLWSGIEWAKSAGCEWFELGGIIPEEDRTRLRAIGEFRRASVAK